MIGALRDVASRVARLEAQLQRPSREFRDDGDLRLRVGRQPDGQWTVRAYNPSGSLATDLLIPAPLVTTLPASPYDGQRADLWAAGRVVPHVFRAGAWRPFAPPTMAVVTLPPDPYDGQTVACWVAGGSLVWMLRYRAGGFADKWEWMGGSPMAATVAAVETTTSTAYTALTTVHRIAAPLPGVYAVSFTAQAFGSASDVLLMAPRVGTATPLDTNAGRYSSAVANVQGGLQRQRVQLTVAAAGEFIELQARVAAGSGAFYSRDLFIQPVRVSPA